MAGRSGSSGSASVVTQRAVAFGSGVAMRGGAPSIARVVAIPSSVLRSRASASVLERRGFCRSVERAIVVVQLHRGRATVRGTEGSDLARARRDGVGDDRAG